MQDNIVPLCPNCHDGVTRNVQGYLGILAQTLPDSERVYIIGKLGEGGMERLFGV